MKYFREVGVKSASAVKLTVATPNGSSPVFRYKRPKFSNGGPTHLAVSGNWDICKKGGVEYKYPK